MKAHYAGWLLAGALALNIIPLQAADITITVNGKVVAKPCTVSTTNASVDLGDLYTFSLVSAGSASAWHSTALDLSNCPVGTSRVVATFSGTADSTGYYKNQVPQEISSSNYRTTAAPRSITGRKSRFRSTKARSRRVFRCRFGPCRLTAAPPRNHSGGD